MHFPVKTKWNKPFKNLTEGGEFWAVFSSPNKVYLGVKTWFSLAQQLLI